MAVIDILQMDDQLMCQNGSESEQVKWVSSAKKNRAVKLEKVESIGRSTLIL